MLRDLGLGPELDRRIEFKVGVSRVVEFGEARLVAVALEFFEVDGPERVVGVLLEQLMKRLREIRGNENLSQF